MKQTKVFRIHIDNDLVRYLNENANDATYYNGCVDSANKAPRIIAVEYDDDSWSYEEMFYKMCDYYAQDYGWLVEAEEVDLPVSESMPKYDLE